MNSYNFENMADRHRTAVIDIFNYYITNTFAAYPSDPVGYEFFDHFLDLAQGYPAVVIKDENDNILGFAFLHPYIPIRTFQHTAKITYFLLPEHTGKGIGAIILKRFITAAKKQGIKTLLANISSLNKESIRFHFKNGFKECGRFRMIGRKFDKYFDVVWMQLHL